MIIGVIGVFLKSKDTFSDILTEYFSYFINEYGVIESPWTAVYLTLYLRGFFEVQLQIMSYTSLWVMAYRMSESERLSQVDTLELLGGMEGGGVPCAGAGIALELTIP
ncbi:hypothetical protein Tco_1210060 [Tanacetum coccineum]